MEFKSDVTELDLSNKGITDISVLADCTALVSPEPPQGMRSRISPRS